MAVPFIHSHRVTYAECTVGNHIYYSRYLDLLEEARGELFRSLRIPLKELQERGILFPVIEARLLYRAPARYDDLLEIQFVKIELTGARLNFGCVISCGGKTLVEAETFHVCANLSEKPQRIPPDVREALSGGNGAVGAQ